MQAADVLQEEKEILLTDRIGVIQIADSKYDLENNAYLSFSGGKDSTILHHLLDIALPNNHIPRVFIDTGIEYTFIREFVLSLSEKDDRFIIVKPSVPIKSMLDNEGYPFKSKEYAHNLGIFQKSGYTNWIKKYLGMVKTKESLFKCPKILRYQFSSDFKLRVDNICCQRLKKDPAKKWEKQSGRTIVITGMRRDEGGQRSNLKGCIITDKEGHVRKFHPLLVVSDDWENWFIKTNNIKLSALYYPPFNFKRTGCKGCPFSLDLQEQLSIMSLYLPNEREQCEFIWKPVYDEYRRIGYRLQKWEQVKLF